MGSWDCVLTLDEGRQIVAGSETALVAALSRGADLRIATRFRHGEHLDTTSDSLEPIDEVAEFGVTYVVEGRWAAGIMSLRQPVDLPVGFGPRPSMSFFLYNQNGEQAIARPYLDGQPAHGQRGKSEPDPPANMPKYHALDNWDAGTNAPCHNLVYDFDFFRFCVRDDWRETESLDDLAEAFRAGQELKVGIGGLCDGLAEGTPARHEVFVQVGSAYYYNEQQLFMAGTHPVVRVRPGVPLRYVSEGWDFGWLFCRSDGRVVCRRCDPYTLGFTDIEMKLSVRWFVR